jgi:hypothetical protein
MQRGGGFLFGQFQVCFLLAAGAFSFWSVLGLFLIGNDNNGVVFSLGSVPRVYFFACLLAVFQKRIMFGGAGPAESMAGETSQQRN